MCDKVDKETSYDEKDTLTVNNPIEYILNKNENDGDGERDEDTSVASVIQKYSDLVLEDNTQKYVITVNGVPQCYTQTLENARNCMWNLARLEKNNQTDYQCFIREMENPNDIQLIGYHRFYIIAYNRTLAHLSVRRVLKIVEKSDSFTFIEEKSKPTMIGRLLGYNY